MNMQALLLRTFHYVCTCIVFQQYIYNHTYVILYKVCVARAWETHERTHTRTHIDMGRVNTQWVRYLKNGYLPQAWVNTQNKDIHDVFLF